ncbi:hypothetical protein HBB16_17040 [Pseudonocardia sp. MCCB 268]|nr:hypothetical protein [Pseudonocardia cytotoxica]
MVRDPPAARLGQPRRRPVLPPDDRPAVVPDRAPPVPRPPSNRYAEIAPEVRSAVQGSTAWSTRAGRCGAGTQVLGTINRLALPNGKR